MAYIRRPSRVPRAQLSGLGGLLASLSEGFGFSKPAPEIQMAEEFVGNVNSLPLCSSAASGAWCRNYIGGSAVKKAGTAVAAATPATASNAGSVIGDFFKALTGSIGSSTMTPAVQAAMVVPPQSGMSTGTKLAIAGGAVALVAIIATRR